jgi:DNA recombination protein RmuC
MEKSIRDEFQRNRNESNELSRINREELARSLKSFEEKFSSVVKELQLTIEKNLKNIREDNDRQLGEMRRTVDEKLQTTLEKRLGESFKQVSERLEQVHKGLGEMQTIASGVGDLKKVLSNVKTRGVLGEYQLGNILEQILTGEQYSKNVATKKGSQAHVEYAIRLPGKSTDEEVWMPVDSKFPIQSYETLMEAYELGSPEQIESAQKVLIRAVEGFARDISEKYIDPPHTTDFGIMFLPVEGLYAEVLRHPGLFETLQRTYKITVTGPTTLSALLNSLQMGFRTLAVQKRSSEVWSVLGAVKSEFSKFSEHLGRVQKQLHTASGSLETLRVTRTNQIERKLRSVETLDPIETREILELPPEEAGDEPKED